AGMNLLPEYDFGIRIVQALVELKVRVFPRLLDGPAGKAASHFGDIFLRVAAVDTERVQLHEFAPVVLIQPANSLLGLLLPSWRRPRPPESAASPLPRGTLRC